MIETILSPTEVKDHDLSNGLKAYFCCIKVHTCFYAIGHIFREDLYLHIDIKHRLSSQEIENLDRTDPLKLIRKNVKKWAEAEVELLGYDVKL